MRFRVQLTADGAGHAATRVRFVGRMSKSLERQIRGLLRSVEFRINGNPCRRSSPQPGSSKNEPRVRPAPAELLSVMTKLKPCTLIGVLCCGVLAFGCGSDTIDDGEIEAEIKKDLAADVGITPKAIECPADIESRAGKNSECTGTAPADDERFQMRHADQ